MPFVFKDSKKSIDLDIAEAINLKKATFQFSGQEITMKALTLKQFFEVLDAVKGYETDLEGCLHNFTILQKFLAEKLPLIVKILFPDLKVDYLNLPLYEALDFIVVFWSVNDLKRISENFTMAMPSKKVLTQGLAASPK